MAEHPLSIIYTVRLRAAKTHKERVVVELVREDYCKQLAYYSKHTKKLLGFPEQRLIYASCQLRPFFDEEDEENILKKCQEFDFYKGKQAVGSIELQVFSLRPSVNSKWNHGRQCIEVRYTSGVLFATWDPVKGIRTNHAHPALTGDKEHIAKVCFELPQGIGGIFKKDSEEEGTSL